MAMASAYDRMDADAVAERQKRKRVSEEMLRNSAVKCYRLKAEHGFVLCSKSPSKRRAF